MPTLTITEFSCLREAVFDLAQVNVIIGPQGSGKSVTTKLFYFFAEIPSNFALFAEKGEDVHQYKKFLAKQFYAWFPPSAWGAGRFNISYTAGPFSIRVLRRRSRGQLADEVSVTFSEWFTQTYARASESFARASPDEELQLDLGAPVRDAIDRVYRVKDVVARRVAVEMGDDYIASQTFIPAGRAFFTSIGRLVAGLGQAGSLDPVTIKFAQLFASLRDRGPYRQSRLARLGSDFVERRSDFMTKLFGGEIKYEADSEYVEAQDGRRIPFASLSSGQQELLPMWSLMDYFNENDALRLALPRGRTGKFSKELVYIEEPEAHLFPSAQSQLMEFLIGSVLGQRQKRSLIITTHSPYIMSTLNVFVKAGQLSRRKKRNQDINEIVPRECWLTDRELSAFAIEDGRLRQLFDEDGLIDGTYLDAVSERIATQYSQLLEIELEM